MNQHDLVPVKAGQDVVDALQDLLSRARDETLAAHGDVAKGGIALEAEITMRMLTLSEARRSVQKVAQGFIVAYVAREQLWRGHPDGFSCLRQFLQAAGLSHGTVCDLVSLGDIIVPFCDHHKIEIDKALTPGQWPNLREAISALRRAAKADDVSLAEEILQDVRSATTRGAVREKYRKHRAGLGHATTMRLPGGRMLMVALINDDEAIQDIVRRLGGCLKWDLVIGRQTGNGDILKLGIDCGQTDTDPLA